MTQERAWRPADYWQQRLYTPPQSTMNWALGAPDDRDSADAMRAQRRRGAQTGNAWNVIAWALAGGFAAGIIATLVAVTVATLVLHLA